MKERERARLNLNVILKLFLDIFCPPSFVASWSGCLLTPWILLSLKGYNDRSAHKIEFPQE